MTPLASVITPVYQTPPVLFEEAFRSLLSQTCGFESVEWLVVIHNMDDDYAESLQRITGTGECRFFARGGRQLAICPPKPGTHARYRRLCLFFGQR